MTELRSPLQALIVQWQVRPGDAFAAGDVLVIIEAMKMEHELRAGASGRVRELLFASGETVNEGDLLLAADRIEPAAGAARSDATSGSDAPAAASRIRPDLQRVIDRHALTLDAQRPEAVARRRERGQRTARENIAGPVRRRAASSSTARSRSPPSARAAAMEDLIAQHAGRRHGDRHRQRQRRPVRRHARGRRPAERTRVVVMAYDATVLAGTQGMRNHQKTDRMLGLALAEPAAGGAVRRRRRRPARATSTCRSSPACTYPPSPASRG